jgi:hypothetical protein
MNKTTKTKRASTSKDPAKAKTPTRLPNPEKRRLAIIELAREQREEEGTIEIDDNAILSESTDNGCYVQAWVWPDSVTTHSTRTGTARMKIQPSTAKPT